ncbi:MAG: Fe-S assembly protein IscX [Candidatus Thermofonsia Clade 1 bacterium]|jgi:FeS assembly protein IscX|uniref:Fe-S assembly protein IscX n=1 Tax=Candidatus Thermofonsia Clade 1 bacterium TaxID=2364210 RepID=A0A2M8PES9_9CHLR|nr:MAG: Fe-S assembly protein IscX [Candidatus Thermofonsia Clade 1 bacterium]RMF51163.1 MAG: Fe-S assembly protein IscX [Chloroflexota bacterium]
MLEFSSEAGFQNALYWEASYEIVLALMAAYPEVDVDSIGLEQLKALIVALPNFADDPGLAHDELLSQILREWWEEIDARR